MQEILLEDRSVFKIIERKDVAPPNWPELAVKNTWHLAAAVPGFLNFMPRDWSAASHKVDRKFFYQTLATLNPEFALSLIEDIRKQKEAAKLAKQKPAKRIGLSQGVIAMLMEHDFTGSKYRSNSFPNSSLFHI